MRVIRLILVFVLIPILAVSTINLVSCSPAPENNQQGGGGSGTTIETVKISGAITNYSSPWKIQAVKGSEIKNGSINSSTTPATYEIVVPKNWGSATVRLYKDNNNNNQFDIGEGQITENVNVGSGNITLNLEIILKISGTINNYQSGWKVGALVGTDIPTLVLGNIQSSGNYTILVVPDSYVQSVILFKDTNDNNRRDSGELILVRDINSTLISNLTIDFTIPNLTPMSITVTVNSNTFGKRVRVIASSYIGTIASSTPSTNASKNHTITIDGTTGVPIDIYIHIDENNDNNLNLTNIGPLEVYFEPMIYITNIQFNSQGVTLPDINLIGHTISGTLTLQNQASGFKPAVLFNTPKRIPMPLGLGTNDNNSYTIEFYTVSGLTNTNLQIVMFKDEDTNGVFNIFNEKVVYFRNLSLFSSSPFPISIDPTTSTNITNNITILRTLLDLTLTGTDAGDFKFVDTNPFLGVIFGTPYTNLPVTNYEIYSDAENIANNPNIFSLILFKDYDGNGIYEGSFTSLKDIEYQSWLIINSLLNSTNINLELVKLVVTNVINGPYTSSTNTYISSIGIGPGGELKTPNYQMQGATNVTIHYGVRLASSSDPAEIQIYNSFATNNQGSNTVSIYITTNSNITINWYVR